MTPELTPETLYLLCALALLNAVQFIIWFYYYYKMKRQRDEARKQRDDLLNACTLLKGTCRKEVRATISNVEYITSVYDMVREAINNCTNQNTKTN